MNQLDLSKLPVPPAVETLDFEQLAEAWRADLEARNPDFTANVESDPAWQEMDVGAYRELLVRNRVNQGVKAVLLSHSEGGDLDQLAANVNLARLLIDPGDPEAVPPQPPVYESDDSLRHRVQLRWEAITTAGSAESYAFHALSADGQVRDLYVVSPEPCEIDIYLLSHDGSTDDALLNAVTEAVSDKRVRPLGDRVHVQSAELVPVCIIAELEIGDGPDAQVILDTAAEAVRALIEPDKPMGLIADLPSIYAALKQPGVGRIHLLEPTADIELQPHQAPQLVELSISRRNG